MNASDVDKDKDIGEKSVKDQMKQVDGINLNSNGSFIHSFKFSIFTYF